MERLRTVVLGMFGATLDRGRGPQRWTSWRPSLGLCTQEDLVVDRFELLHSLRDTASAEQLAADIHQASPETDVRTHVLPLTDAWDFEQVFAALHDFARGYTFDLEAERYLIHITTGTHVMQICFFLLTESRHFPGVLVQTSPPTKGEALAGRYALIDLDLSKYDVLARRFAAEQAEGLSFLKSGIDTRDPAFNRLIAEIEQVAVRSRAPILLSGPTGAGKSQLAQQIYALKKARRQLAGPLVEVNCATLRGDGAQSALFGHVRGAYTGAQQAREGFLRRADGGVLFLDEIGELGLDEQAMLLRAVEQRRFLPVGADAEVESDFQLIAGTNRDLRAAVRAGRFREDLLARIDLWTWRLPGLAERRADIEPNLDFELRRAGEGLGVQLTMNREARRLFLRFAATAPWPANFRDLAAAVLRMGTLAPAGRIDEATAQGEIARLERAWAEPEKDDGLTTLLGEKANEIDGFDRVQLAEVVRICQQSATLAEAGRRLFSASRAQRTTHNDGDRLRKYLAKFELTFAEVSPGR